jgi:FKBP-type peptidyl-prolyl cis-trans isomerase
MTRTLTSACLCLLVVTIPASALRAQAADSPATQPAATAAETWVTDGGVGITCTDPGGVGAAVGDTVWVHYVGRLANGAEFDNSLKGGEAIEFVLGEDRVIKGWEQGILGMKMGEKRHLSVPPEMAYGVRGMGGSIPPNARLEFDVELVGLLRSRAKTPDATEPAP